MKIIKQKNRRLIALAFLQITVLFLLTAFTDAEIFGQTKNKAGARFSSVYTDTTKQCKGAEPTFTCTGYGGYRLVLDISGAFSNARIESTTTDYSLTIAERQSVGWNPKVEWRTANGEPFAVIVRTEVNDENADIPKKSGEQLIVKGLQGYENIAETIGVKTPQANEKARAIADENYADVSAMQTKTTGITKRITLSKKKPCVILTGSVQAKDFDTYIFRAAKGQTVIAEPFYYGDETDRPEDDEQGLSGFVFVDPNGEESEDPQDVVFPIEKTGEYKILVRPAYKRTTGKYALKISVTNKMPKTDDDPSKPPKCS